jgi:hypothetical protein
MTLMIRPPIIGVSDQWILQPEDPWEVTGYVPNVVFTCGAVPEDDGTVKIYWGGADTVMCAGTAVIDELVGFAFRLPTAAVGFHYRPMIAGLSRNSKLKALLRHRGIHCQSRTKGHDMCSEKHQS